MAPPPWQLAQYSTTIAPAGEEALAGPEVTRCRLARARADFTSRFITVHRNAGGGQPAAVIDWTAAVDALGVSLPCSGGEQRMLKITASLADGIPVDLRDTITGLDDRNTSLVIKAVLHAAGQIKARASEP